MEDIQPISAAEQASFCVELMKRLNIQRKQDYLCDITLVSKDNIELKAHRNVLSAASPFFYKLLQSDMKENREGIIRLEEISGSVMEDVLEFIYTGTIYGGDSRECRGIDRRRELSDHTRLENSFRAFFRREMSTKIIFQRFISLRNTIVTNLSSTADVLFTKISFPWQNWMNFCTWKLERSRNGFRPTKLQSMRKLMFLKSYKTG